MTDPFYRLIRPLLFALPTELSHSLASGSLRLASATPLVRTLIQSVNSFRHPALGMELFGVHFPNPVGLAAGWDKDARYIRGARLIGMGFTELGTVTPLPQPGNPRPRLFRIPEQEALLNRMSFNSRGADAMAGRLARTRSRQAGSIPIGINLGKNWDTPLDRAVEDYEHCLERLHAFADYLVLNVSSPNTPGLRDLQEPELLGTLLTRIVPKMRELDRTPGPETTPILIKLGPDRDPRTLPEIVDAALQAGISGFIATNTTSRRYGLTARWQEEEGGLSGAPLAERGRAMVSELYRLSGGGIPIIGVGGITGPRDAYSRIRAGASLVQVYTGLVYEGPRLARFICRGLVDLLRGDGFEHLSEAVGADHHVKG
jgi:dihydroorotate dehydrogenase